MKYLPASNGMNKILERQLKKTFGSLDKVPGGLEEFLKIVSDTYDHAEEDRKMIERSLDLSSKELGDLNKKTMDEAEKLKKSVGELERMNKLMVDRELKMIELKKENRELKEKENK
jgi:two-component system, NtrC family, sensor kinase